MVISPLTFEDPMELLFIYFIKHASYFFVFKRHGCGLYINQVLFLTCPSHRRLWKKVKFNQKLT